MERDFHVSIPTSPFVLLGLLVHCPLSSSLARVGICKLRGYGDLGGYWGCSIGCSTAWLGQCSKILRISNIPVHLPHLLSYTL